MRAAMREESDEIQGSGRDGRQSQEFRERPWIVLNNSYDMEAWIDQFNRELQQAVTKPHAGSHGMCLRLTHGGEIFLHTAAEGEVLLDLTPEAEWAAPVIAAATGIAPPPARIWCLPGASLTQLLLGLSTLIEATRIVTDHDFRIRKQHWTGR